MATTRGYIVRPPPKAPRTDLKDVFWIYLSPASLLLHGLRPKDVCRIQTPQSVQRYAIVLENANIQDSVVQTSKALQTLYGLKIGDNILVSKYGDPISGVESVNLEEVLEEKQREPVSQNDCAHWAWVVKHALTRAEHLSPGMVIGVEAIWQKRTFKVTQINDIFDIIVHRFIPDSDITVKIETAGNRGHSSTPSEYKSLQISNDRVAGLDSQLLQINNALTSFEHSHVNVTFPAGYPSLQGGIIIHGPSGTGKTLLLDLVADSGWRSTFRLTLTGKSQSESDSSVRQIFAEARQRQPSLITIDRLDVVAGKNRDSATAVNLSQCLGAEMDGLEGDRILVIAATRSLADVSDELRGPGRFDLEIESAVPDARSRLKILRIISGSPGDQNSQMLQTIGDRTHGYVGADLRRLFRGAMRKAQARVLAAAATDCVEKSNGEEKFKLEATVIEDDLNAALLEVRPSAMREVFLETPKVRWSDIGGQHEVKRSLQKAIEWPIKYSEQMKLTGQEPTRGLLLYGPPGCSKTLVAKALATEADFNFIAVKGAELLSMYVGESERAVREVFRKARAASPSIIFFDEIDALGASRETSNGGLNVLTTLLNELDGIEDLKGVFVLAATNNPAILDPALIRPGRFSKLFYIGPPDVAARADILRLRLRKVNHDEDIDVSELARATEGYSGAEIVEICQKAGEAAMEKWLELGNRTFKPIMTMKQFLKAIESTERGVSREQIRTYERWKADRR